MAFRWVGVPRAIILLSILAIAWGTRLGTRWPAIYYMTGPSMEPTVRARELFVTWSPAGSLVRGDLVIFEFQDADGDFHVLRRVVGLPGDTLAMQDGTLFLNGRRAHGHSASSRLAPVSRRSRS